MSFHLVGGLVPGSGLWAGLLPNQPGALLIIGETRGSDLSEMPRSLMAARRGFGPEAPAPADLEHGHDQFDPGNHAFN